MSSRLPKDVLLVSGLLVEEGFSTQTIWFFQQSYLFLTSGLSDNATGTDLAQFCKMTAQAGVTHLKQLVTANLLTRRHYRSWALNHEHIKEKAQGVENG